MDRDTFENEGFLQTKATKSRACVGASRSISKCRKKGQSYFTLHGRTRIQRRSNVVVTSPAVVRGGAWRCLPPACETTRDTVAPPVQCPNAHRFPLTNCRTSILAYTSQWNGSHAPAGPPMSRWRRTLFDRAIALLPQ